MVGRRWVATLVWAPLVATLAWAGQVDAITLEEALSRAREQSPELAAARAELERAQAARRTARQYPNPSVNGWGGQLRARRDDVNEGATYGVGVQQPLESPRVRGARARASDAALAVAEAGARAAETELAARVKRAFSDAVRAAELRAVAEEQVGLLERVREGIRRKVDVGEGPGLDLARAETELLQARADLAQAEMIGTEARLGLARAVGTPGGGELDPDGAFPPLALPEQEELRASLAESNPRIEEARRGLGEARERLDLQRHKRFDGFGVGAEWSREPDDERLLLALRVPLPAWNRRRGQIGEASARVKKAQAELAMRELSLLRELDTLYSRHRVAQQQVSLIETGMLQEARRALRGADVAYRSGERGILEVLDAQRTLRAIRLDLLTARSEMERTGIEIERLAGVTR